MVFAGGDPMGLAFFIVITKFHTAILQQIPQKDQSLPVH